MTINKKPFVDSYVQAAELVDVEKQVKVYRNLHRGCWSVMQNGLVAFHCSHLSLANCTFRVNEKGRKRVIRNKRKEVHAFVSGRIPYSVGFSDVDFSEWPVHDHRVTYNPYLCGSFLVDDEPETMVARVRFMPSGFVTAMLYSESVLRRPSYAA